MSDSIDLSEKLATFSEHFTVAQFNNFDVMVVKLKGEFVWHKHDDTDDLFLVLKGVLDIQLRDRNRAPAGRHSQPDLSQFGGRLSFAPAQFHPSSVLRASELQRMDATLAAPGCWVCSTWCRTPAMNLHGICRLANLSLRSTASVQATFFDTRERLDNEGIDDTLRRSFLVYLVSHSGPMHEVLTARRKDMTADFGRSCITEEPVTLKELTRLARLSLRRSWATCRILTECF